MTEPAKPLRHASSGAIDDAALKAESEDYLARTPSAQLVGELLIQLRLNGFAWWTPDRLRARWPAADRMAWLEQRGDIRQHITTRLTGLAPRAARRMTPVTQAELIDAVIDTGDITTLEFEEEFEPSVTAVYGPAAEIWRQFRTWMPWHENTPDHQELVSWLLTALLADRTSLREGSRTPILRHWDVRTAIDHKVWHARIPLDIRARIDEARFERERRAPNKAFNALDDLAIATPSVIATSIPLVDLARVLDVAERAMGFHAPPAEVSGVASVPGAEVGARTLAATPVAAPAPAANPAAVMMAAMAAAVGNSPTPTPAPPGAVDTSAKRTSDVQARPANEQPQQFAVQRPAPAPQAAVQRPAAMAAAGVAMQPRVAGMAGGPRTSPSLSIPRPPADLAASLAKSEDVFIDESDADVSTSVTTSAASIARKPAAPARRSRPPQR